MTFFEKELKKMFGNNSALKGIRYVGNVLVGRLTDDTFAKISFITSNIQSQYTSVLIRVINPKIGEADRQTLNFSETFGLPKNNIHIWDDHGDVGWSHFTPSRQNYEAINRAAQQYLEMFLEPVHDMGMSM